jgi:general stress protein YciG
MADNTTNMNQFEDQQEDQQINSGGNLQQDRQRASEMGKKGAETQPRSAKAEGGRNSHRGSESSE